MALSEEDKQEIAEMIAAASTPTPTDDNPITLESIGAMFEQHTKKMQNESAKELQTQFRDTKLNELYEANPGFKEFMEQEDTWGKKPIEHLDAMPFSDQITKLGKLYKEFAQSQIVAGDDGESYMTPEQKEQQDDLEKKYDNIDKGEYENIAEMDDDFFSTLAQEADMLMGT